MRPLFIANHPAIDFLNTALAPNGEPIETIAGGTAFLHWMVDARFLEQAVADALARRVGAKALDAAAAEARKVRELGARLAHPLAHQPKARLPRRACRIKQTACTPRVSPPSRRSARQSEGDRGHAD